jgi:hypothetical protein
VLRLAAAAEADSEHPLAAAAAKALSSPSVVGNANRLRGWQPAPVPETRPAWVTPQVQIGSSAGPAVAGQNASHHSPGETAMHHSYQPPAQATAVDPVCGMNVAPDTSRHDHRG